MCGIAGFVERPRPDNAISVAARRRLDSMLRTIHHRGPDDWGMAFFNMPAESEPDDDGHLLRHAPATGRLALGHRRLSILDLSPSGRQPMTSRDGALTITFNGEIYNYIELREELSRDATFQTGSDTEVLLEAYRQWGSACFNRLDGMYAFAIWDARAGKLVCARDPMGIKPFYYAVTADGFFFGSEPRTVLAGLGTPGHVDRVAIAEFLVLGITDHDERTSFDEVRQLRGGHALEVSADGTVSTPRQFWTAPRDEVGGSEEEVLSRVRAQFDQAIHRQLRSDVPVGSCLSSGIDSGCIVGTIGKLLGPDAASSFIALTLTNKGFERDEGPAAEATARRAGVRWVPVEPTPGRIGEYLEDLFRELDEPCGGISMLAQRDVMNQARNQGLKVVLDGQGGDEVFFGYPRVAQLVIGTYLAHGRLGPAFREWIGFSRNASRSLAGTVAGNIFFSSPRLARLRNSWRTSAVVNWELVREVRSESVQGLFSRTNLKELQISELTRFSLPQLLRYEDRNSMKFSLEARVPYLAVELVEEVLRLPWEWKVRDGWTKYALRRAMVDRVSADVLWQRSKKGYDVPQGRWLQEARPLLVEWFRSLPPNCPIDTAALIRRIDAGSGDDRSERWLWKAVSVALWLCMSGVRI